MRACFILLAFFLLGFASATAKAQEVTEDAITRNYGCLAFGSVEDRAHYRVLRLRDEVIANRGDFWPTATAEYIAYSLQQVAWPERRYMEHANIMDVESMMAGELMDASNWHGRGRAPLLTEDPGLFWGWMEAAEEEVDEFISKTESVYLDSGLTCVERHRPVRVEPAPPPVEEEQEPYEAPTALAIMAMLQDNTDDPPAMIEIMRHPEHQRVLTEDHALKPAMRFVVDKTIEREQQRLGALMAAGEDSPEQYRASARALDGVRLLSIELGLDYRREELDSGIELFRAKSFE